MLVAYMYVVLLLIQHTCNTIIWPINMFDNTKVVFV